MSGCGYIETDDEMDKKADDKKIEIWINQLSLPASPKRLLGFGFEGCF
jgi:hypothetical protein